MKKTDFRKYLPYLVALLIFIGITLIYFSPLLEGKRIQQSDIMQFKGASKEIADYRKATGKEPLWTNSMFGGMPAYQISVIYKGNIFGYLDTILGLGLPHPANLVFLYFLGFFILLLVMKVDPWLSIAGAIAFAFSSYFFIIIDAGHNSKAHAIAYMAPVIAGIILTLRKQYIWGGILTAIALTLEIKANHPQITYYLLLLVFILGLFELVSSVIEKRFPGFLRSLGILIVAALFAVLTNITSLWATWEYGKYTIRGKSELTVNRENKTSGLDKDYATRWSYGIGETMTLLIPDFYGGSSSARLSENSEVVKALKQNNVSQNQIRQFISYPLPLHYWGDQPGTSGPVYVGAIIVFLFILGLIIVKGPVKWWLLTATLLSVMLSWGHNFMMLTDFFMDFVPGYNKFRAVSMTLVIAEFTMPLLAILALKELFDPGQNKKKLFRSIQIALGISAGLALLFILIPGLFLSFTGPNDPLIQESYKFPDWLMQAVRDERARLVRMDALRSLIYMVLAAALSWALLYSKLKKIYISFILAALILADMYVINKRYLNNDSLTTKSKVEKPFVASAADAEILKDSDPDFRVLNLSVDAFNDASTSWFHKSIGGYHGAKLRRYQEVIEQQISKNNMAVWNMLNTKYVITPGENRAPMAQRNYDALGHAWFVEGVKIVDNADQEMAALSSFNPADTAIVDERFQSFLREYTPGRETGSLIELKSYTPNRLEYQYTARKNSLAVFSEIYYPKGWNAYVDGAPTPHFRVNYILRGMVLPAGKHTVVFSFEPRVYALGETVSLTSSLVLLALILGLVFLELRKQWKSTG